MLGTALAYWLTARFGLAFATVHGAVSPVWPPTGLSVALLLLGGPRLAPGIFLGAIAADLVPADGHCPLALGMAVGNALEPLVAVWLLRWAQLDLRLGRTRDVLRFAVGGAALPALVSAGIGVSTLFLTGAMPAGQALTALWVWWLGNAMGALIVTPALLQLARLRSWGLAGRGPETLAALALTALVGLAVFLRPTGGGSAVLVPAFLLFPLCVWSALRLGPEGAALANLILGALCIGGTVQGLGPFGGQAHTQDLLLLQLFLGVIAGTALLVAAATSERQRVAARFALFATTVRSVQEGVVISEVLPAGGGLRIVFANEALAALLGYRPEELVGRTPRSLLGLALDPETRARLDRALAEGSHLRVEVTLARKDGTLVQTEQQLSPVRDADGRLTHFVATHRDVTALKQLQARQLASERIASMATLAAGVGHEINNALAYLSASLQVAQQRLARQNAGEEVRGRVEDALEGAERIGRIVRELRMYSRGGSEDRRAPLELPVLVGPALRMASHALQAKAQLVQELEPAPRVLGDEARLGQVLLNLLMNAGQAVSGPPERNVIRVRTGTDPQGRALLEVEDSGVGIAPEALPHLFEPFFTTKAEGGGTGLGLAICRQIVEAHGGELRVRSTRGQGSVFSVHLPPAPAPAQAAAPASAPASGAQQPGPGPASRRGRILIIEDEVRLAQSMRLLLEPAHEVVTTTRGSEALTWMEHGQRFDVVLCDLHMPETTGMDVYMELHRSAPALAERLVFLSGGAFTPAALDFMSRVKNPVLQKPVRPEALLAAVDAALARPAPRS
nr:MULTISPECIES: MASE1 domain-containing protein [Myxococcaceae]